MPKTAILIGQPTTCRRMEQQLALLRDPPEPIGWIVQERAEIDSGRAWDRPVLGTIDGLEAIVAEHRPDVALVSLPAVMTARITSLRTRLRRLGVPDRFLPTLEDQLDGVGPRTHLDVDLADLLGRPPKPFDEAAVRSVIEGRRVLITGAGGSIGGELARLVAAFAPRRLALVDRSENALFEIDRQIAAAAPTVERDTLLHDVVDARLTRRLFERLRPEVIFHAAAHKHVPMMEDHPSAAVDNNLFGTRSVVDAADAIGARRCVMISTDKAVNPSSVMGATKRLAELYVQAVGARSETSFSMVRFGNVLGSSGSVLDIWARQIADGGPLTVTEPEMTRYFMTIPEAAALVVQSAALVDGASDAGEIFVLDMGEPVRIIDLAVRFAAMHGLRAVRPDASPGSLDRDVPGVVHIVYTGRRPGEKLHEQLAIEPDALRPTDHPDIRAWLGTPPDERTIQTMLAELAPDRRPRDPVALARCVRELVPEAACPAAA